MERRHVLSGVVTTLAAFAGCNSVLDENPTSSPTDSPTATPTPSQSPTSTATPTERPLERVTPTGPPSEEVIEAGPMEQMPDDFPKEWQLHRDDDWILRRRRFERPDSDEAVDWTPDYALSEEFVHEPSLREFEAAVDAAYVPPIQGIVASKWALPTDFSGTSADLVAEASGWFEGWFRTSGVDMANPSTVHTGGFELESGAFIGRDIYSAVGDTAHLEIVFEATIDGEPLVVERVTYEAEGLLLGFVDLEARIGYLVGSGWPTTDTLTLHTTDGDDVDVSAPVAADLSEMQEVMVPVLEAFDQ